MPMANSLPAVVGVRCGVSRGGVRYAMSSVAAMCAYWGRPVMRRVMPRGSGGTVYSNVWQAAQGGWGKASRQRWGPGRGRPVWRQQDAVAARASPRRGGGASCFKGAQWSETMV